MCDKRWHGKQADRCNKRKSVSEIESLGFDFIVDLIGIDPGPARAKCATISLKALKHAVFIYEHKKPDGETERL
jgi:hypothetical protein